MADAVNTEEVYGGTKGVIPLVTVFATVRAEIWPWSVDMRIRLHHGLMLKLMLLICDGFIKHHQFALMMTKRMMGEVENGRADDEKYDVRGR